MDITSLFFYLFSGTITISSLGVIASANPVYSLLWLIFAFCNAAGLFILFGAEYLGMVLIIVYVGAVAVLFLFVIMMLDIDIAQMKKQMRKYMLLGGVFGLALLLNISLIAYSTFINTERLDLSKIQNQGQVAVTSELATHDNEIKAKHDYQNIGEAIYTEHVVAFQVAGAILLVSMLGCIVLTINDKISHRRQNSLKQTLRNSEDSIEIVKVQKGLGVDV